MTSTGGGAEGGTGGTVDPPGATPAPEPAATDPASVLRSRGYLKIVILSGLMGIPISFIAFWFIQLVHHINTAIFDTLPTAVGFHEEPVWWPIPWLVLSGLLVAAAIRYLPGNGGHSPADGFSAGMTEPKALFGVVAAALATLGLGAVLGPEAPLIAIGSGLGLLTIRLANRESPPMAQMVVAAAGSFAALATILGSPIVAALFMLEAIGLGGPALSLVIVPGLLAGGLGSLVFIGLGSWTGLGTLSLAIPDLPPITHPTFADVGWAVLIGLMGAVAAVAIRRSAVTLRSFTEPRKFLTTPVVGLAIALLAVIYAESTGKPTSDLLFSGQQLIGPLVSSPAAWTVSALVILVVLKAVAYSLSLSSFRGGPIFPALLLGAATGVAMSHLPGVGLVPGVAMGMGAFSAGLLRLPVASVALPSVLLFHDGVAVAPVVIVAVVVSFVAVSWLDPRPPAQSPPPATPPPAPAQT
jgi:H+/Cl- antiporter ClcA